MHHNIRPVLERLRKLRQTREALRIPRIVEVRPAERHMEPANSALLGPAPHAVKVFFLLVEERDDVRAAVPPELLDLGDLYMESGQTLQGLCSGRMD